MATYRLSRQRIDIIFKREAQRLVEMLPRHLGLNLPPVVAQLPTERPHVDIHMEELDAVFRLADGTILHLEFQTTHKRQDLLRFLLYDIRLFEQYGVTIRTIVIFGAGIDVADDRIGGGSFSYQVDNVFIGKQDGEEVLQRLQHQVTAHAGLDPDARLDLVFLPLMRHTRPMTAILHTAVDLARALPLDEQRGTLAALLGLGARYLEQAQLDTLVEDLMSTVTGQQLLEQSYQDGIRDGTERGRLLGLRESILATLSTRFTTVPDTLRVRLEAIDSVDQLTSLVAHAAVTPSLEEFLHNLP